MATQKRLNKNLVAFLTVMGMVLAVSVFAMLIYQQSRRDPKLLADLAQQAEQSDDLGEAVRRYLRAYEASRQRGEPNTEYVIHASRCLFQLGEILNWRGLLLKELANRPDDLPLRQALLEGLWRIRDISGATSFAQDWRDTGQALVDKDPNNAPALASLAMGLWALRGEEGMKAADEAVARAYNLDPTQPRVALAYGALLQRRNQTEFDEARLAGARRGQLSDIVRKFIAEMQKVFEPAVVAHPADTTLAAAYAGLLDEEARRLLPEAGDTSLDEQARAELLEQANALFARAGDVLLATLAAQGDQEASPELYAVVARLLWGRLVREKGSELQQLANEPARLDAAERTELRRRIAEIEQQAARAVELDPAVYDSYLLQGELKQYEAGPGDAALTTSQRFEKMLAVLSEARDRTLILRSPRAQLRTEERLVMLRRAFDLALAWLIEPGETGREAECLARAEVLLKDAQVKYPEHPLTHFMHGQFQIAQNQVSPAIRSFQQAYDRVEKLRVGQGRFWRAVGVGRLPSEQLALLYRQQNQSGEAQRFASLALSEYRTTGLRPPLLLIVNTAELWTQVGKTQEALDLVNAYRDDYPNSRELLAVRTAIMTKLNPQAGAAAMPDVTGDDVNTKLWRGRWSAEQGDYAKAEAVLREVLDDASASDRQYREALQRLLGVLDADGRRAEARAFVRELLQGSPRAGVLRLLQAYEVQLATEDANALTPEERQAQEARWLEIIKDNPDPQAREAEYIAFYVTRMNWEQALPHVEALRKLDPNSLDAVEQEFRVRLALRQFKEAEGLLSQLAQANDGAGHDRAGGALYRGELAAAQGDGESALREFRHAVSVLPKSDELFVRLARACLLAGRVNEALTALEQAVESNPRSFVAYWMLRHLYTQKAGESFGEERTGFEAKARAAQVKAMEINPRHPQVRAWKQEQDEETAPLVAIAEREKRRARSPDDRENTMRLAQLYVSAWGKAAADNEEAAKQQLVAGALPFFEAVLATATEDARLELLQQATEFYARAGVIDKGEALLRGLVNQEAGANKIELQLLVGKFFERAGNPAAAEREYQQAQRLAGQVTQDPLVRQQLDRRVGLVLMGYYDEQRRPDKVGETCRWLLDRLGAGAQADEETQHVRLMLIQSLFGARQLEDAQAEVDVYVRSFPDDVRGLAARAQLHLLRGARPEAQADLSKILEKDPEHVWSHFTLGRLALEQGRYDVARAALTRAAGLLARYPALELDVHRYLGVLYERTKEYELAETEYRTVLDLIEKQPNRTAEQRQQVVSRLIRLIYNSLKQFDRAQRLISEYMEKQPDDGYWPFELGRLFKARAESQKRPEDARRDYDQAASYFQRSYERTAEKNIVVALRPLLERMNALTKCGRPEEAARVGGNYPFHALPPATPEDILAEIRARLTVELARALQAQKQTAPATEKWQAALRDAAIRGSDLAAFVVKEMSKTPDVQPRDVEALVRSVAEAAPADALAGQRLRLVLATHLNDAGMPAAALPYLSDVLSRVPPGSPEHQAALLAQAITLQAAGDRAGAVKGYRDALAAYPDNLTALNNLAYLLVESEPPLFAPAEALKYAERLRGRMTASEEGAAALDTIGWVNFKNSNNDVAAATLEESLALGGPSVTVNLHLGQVYLAQGRTTEARSVLNKGLELARQGGNADEVRRYEELQKKLP